MDVRNHTATQRDVGAKSERTLSRKNISDFLPFRYKTIIYSAFALSLLTAHTAFAVTWQGGAVPLVQSMQQNTNWVGLVTPLPGAATVLTFPGTTGVTINPIDDIAPIGAFILNAMQITGTLTTGYSITPSGASTFAFQGATPTITVTGAAPGQVNALSVPIDATSTTVLVMSTNGIFNYSGAIPGATPMTYRGSNTAITNLNDIVQLTGVITAAAGTTALQDNIIVLFDNAGCFGTGAITFSAGIGTLGATLQPTATPLTLAQPITNVGVPAFFDFTQVVAGTLTVPNLTMTTNTLTVNGAGTLALTAPTSAITGTTAVTLTGGSTLSLNTVAGATYAGPTTITSGTLLDSSAGGNMFSPNSAVTLANNSTAFLNLNGQPNTIFSLAGGGTLGGDVLLGAGTLTISGGLPATTYGGSISGTGGLTLTSSSNLTLTGTNTYSGATNITTPSILQAGAVNALSPLSPVILGVGAGTSLLLNNNNNVIQSLSGGAAAGGNVSLGSGTLTLQLGGLITTYDGAITGTGGLTVNGVGTQQLSGSGVGLNTYTGPTTILAGTLMATATNAFAPNSIVTLANNPTAFLDLGGFNNQIGGLAGGGAAGGNVLLGANTLQINNTTNTSYAGTISGVGGVLDLRGSGILQLTGTNTYSGTTFIGNAGAPTLQAGATNAFSPNSVVNIVSGTLDLNNFNNSIPGLTGTGAGTVDLGTGTLTVTGVTQPPYAGAIIGVGGGLTLNQTAGNNLTLTGSNISNYSGTTTILSGSLIAGAPNAFSPLSIVNLANSPNAILNLNNFSNTIGGLSGGGAAGGNVLLGGGAPTLTIQNATSATYGGVISQPGNLVLTGPGTQTLTGVNTYTGTTTVSGGTLLINAPGSISSATTVNPGGTLGGTGTIIGAVIVNGTMSPGDTGSIGTFNITGPYTQGAGSNFLNQITPTSTDLLAVTGAVTINPGATFTLVPTPGVYGQNQTYVVITATGGVGGTFTNFASTSLLLAASLSYPPNQVVLNISFVPVANFVGSGNAHITAVAFDQVISSGSLALDDILTDIFFLSQSELINAFDQMHPAQLKAQTLVQANNALKVRDAVINHLAPQLYDLPSCCEQPEEKPKCSTNKNHIPCCRPSEQKSTTVWIEGLGDWLEQSRTHYSNSPQVGYSNTTAGVILGADYHFSDVVQAGILGAYTNSNTHWHSHRGHGNIDSGYLGIYLSAVGKWAYAMASTIETWSAYDSSRNIIFPGVSATAKGKTTGGQLISSLDTGLLFKTAGFTISPFDTLDYIAQKEKGFTEDHGGPYNLKIRTSRAYMVRNELGLNIARTECAHNGRWIFDSKISWVREVRYHAGHFTSTFVGTNVPFTVTGYMPNRNLVSPGASITGLLCREKLTVNVYYNGLYAHKFSDNTVGAGIAYNF